MFEVDKQAFGAFVAILRKEQGYTQKDLAQRLFISDKAVSKWETGASLPDTALLIPLAELLGVSVTELLLCRRTEPAAPMEAGEVERIVKTAISCSGEEQLRSGQQRSRWRLVFFAALLLACAEAFFIYMSGNITDTQLVIPLLGALFGWYFCFHARTKLPAYYDENQISVYGDGFFRLNIPGVFINNSNWPHIVHVGRVWCVAVMLGYPLLCLLMDILAPGLWRAAALTVTLALVLGGLFVPMYVVGKKHG